MVELVNGLDVGEHLRYHFLWEHAVRAVLLVHSEVKDLRKYETGMTLLEIILVI
jgi:hypothetical protein